MKKRNIIVLSLVGILAFGSVAIWQISNTAAVGGSSTNAVSAAGATVMVLPVTKNPILNTSTQPGLEIAHIAVQDNVDPTTKAAINDRLQITLKNSGTSTLAGFEVFYTMTDVTTKMSESYYQKLTGISLPAGESTTVYFDNLSETGHFPENSFSIYRSSTNQVDFTVQVSAKDVARATAVTIKDPGTGEKVD